MTGHFITVPANQPALKLGHLQRWKADAEILHCTGVYGPSAGLHTDRQKLTVRHKNAHYTGQSTGRSSSGGNSC